jgi:hypothetical protein
VNFLVEALSWSLHYDFYNSNGAYYDYVYLEKPHGQAPDRIEIIGPVNIVLWQLWAHFSILTTVYVCDIASLVLLIRALRGTDSRGSWCRLIPYFCGFAVICLLGVLLANALAFRLPFDVNTTTVGIALTAEVVFFWNTAITFLRLPASILSTKYTLLAAQIAAPLVVFFSFVCLISLFIRLSLRYRTVTLLVIQRLQETRHGVCTIGASIIAFTLALLKAALGH